LMSGLGSLLTAAWFPYASVLYNHSAWLAMVAMTTVSGWSADLPGAWFHVASPSLVALAGYYLLLIALGADTRPYWTRGRVALLVTGALLVAGTWIARWSTAGLQITVLPLRGGDSLFVDAPGSASDLLVDTGDDRATEQVVHPFLRARGVNRLPNLVLTHGDVRHVGGAAVIREDFQVAQTITSRVKSRSPAYRALVKELELTGTGWRPVERGDRVCGWRVLHPAAEDRFSRADDNALVLLGEFEGVRLLLCSDLGRLGQRTLLEREPGLCVDVVIAGMPSPDEPLSDGFLRLLGPQLVVVSAGEYPASERPSEESGFAKGSGVKAVDGRDVAIGSAGNED
jgi:competence protein ComEC